VSINRGIALRDEDGTLASLPDVFCLQCTTRERREVRHQPPECAEPQAAHAAQVVQHFVTTGPLPQQVEDLRCVCGHARSEHSNHWQTACTRAVQVLRGSWTWERCRCDQFVTLPRVTFCTTADDE
jgi:hypothetical protein